MTAAALMRRVPHRAVAMPDVARPKPRVNASKSNPATTKLADWIQPLGPRASELTGCRHGL